MAIEDQVKMAIDSGCQWIELDPKGIYETKAKSTLDEIVNACKEAGVILVFKHDDALVDQLRVHGVRLSAEDKSPLELRERFGGHAIIGIEATPDSDFAMMRRADADYVVAKSTDPDYIAAVKVKMTEAGVNIPIVAEGEITKDDFMSLLAAGASGYNIDINSLCGPEYNISLRGLIEALPL